MPISSSGATLTGAVTGLSDGTTYSILIRAVNPSGGGASSLPASVTPLSTTTTTTPIPPIAPTNPTTTPTTTPEGGSGDGVSLSGQAARAGVNVAGTGGLQLSLICPSAGAGCDADGNLVLAGGPHAVIAHFVGAQIASGHSRLVSVKLTPAATRYIQTRGIRRVRATLTIHNHLSGRADVTTRQLVWLNIAALRASCPAAIGTLTGSSLAQMRLGLTRTQAHRLGHHRKAGYGFERYCLTGGSIRVRYPESKLLSTLSAAQRHQDQGRVYLALTTNTHYTAGGVRTGMTVAAARARLRLGVGVTVGKNTWYLVATKRAAWVLKAQHGIIREIGITNRSLTSTPRTRRTVFRHL